MGPWTLHRLSLRERFALKVICDVQTRCWVWTGAMAQGDRGQFWDGDRMVTAARWAWEQVHGPIPGDLQVLHRQECQRAPTCVWPRHLYLGTNLDNRLDRRDLQTHCKRGHALTPDNIYDDPKGRFCKTCARGRAHAVR